MSPTTVQPSGSRFPSRLLDAIDSAFPACPLTCPAGARVIPLPSRPHPKGRPVQSGSGSPELRRRTGRGRQAGMGSEPALCSASSRLPWYGQGGRPGQPMSQPPWMDCPEGSKPMLPPGRGWWVGILKATPGLARPSRFHLGRRQLAPRAPRLGHQEVLTALRQQPRASRGWDVLARPSLPALPGPRGGLAQAKTSQ